MYELPAGIQKILTIAYIFLPLGLAGLAGICLLLAALRKSLSGGTALALGGLAGIIVAGSLVLDAHNLSSRVATTPTAEAAAPAPSPVVPAMPGAVEAKATDATAVAVTAEATAISPRIYKIATIGYAVLPLGLAALAGLALLIATLGKTVNGASALALGGLAGVVVLGSVFSLRGPDGANISPLAQASMTGSAPVPTDASDADGAADAAPAPVAFVTVEAARAYQEMSEQQVSRISTGLENTLATSAKHDEALATLKDDNKTLRERNASLGEKVGRLEGELSATKAQLQEILRTLHARPSGESGGGSGGAAPAPGSGE